MVRLVDVPLDNGDPNRVTATINDSIRQEGTTASQRTANSQTTEQTRRSVGDPRFAGKSPEEIVEMYRNLESHSGRLASQLGETRNQLNAVILGKRENDLRQNSPAPVKVESSELLVNPTEALDRYLASRQDPEVLSLKERLAQLEGRLSQTQFTVNHKNADQTTADPEFQAWARQTPLRMRLAQQAGQGNFEAADALLQEWNSAKAAKEAAPSLAQERAQELARSMELEDSTTGTEGATRSTGKTFKRADLIRLRQTDPDLYESPRYQREIVKAYQEGRVTD